jgi:hypothetical protein
MWRGQLSEARWMLWAAVLAGVAVFESGVYANERNAPECFALGVPPQYAPLNAPPSVQVTRVASAAITLAGSGCFEKSDSLVTWLTVASLVQTPNDRNAFIERFGAISKLLAVRYWSTTDHEWRPLVAATSAIVRGTSGRLRADYSVAELALGENDFYSVTDSRSGRDITYRLRVWPTSPDNLVIDIVNVDAIRQWGITLYAAGGLHTLYWLQHRSPGIWAYYSITRILPHSSFAQGHDKSLINRAVALYRHFVGLATDAEPPAAP